MSNSLLWSQPKELASAEWKIGILHKFRKRGQPREVYANCRKLFPRNFRSIWLSSRNFRNFRLNGSLFGNSTISYFLELFPGNFRTICPRFENFEILGWLVSAHVYTDTEKFRPSLPSQCFNPRQPSRIALNLPHNLFVRWESRLLEDLFLE